MSIVAEKLRGLNPEKIGTCLTLASTSGFIEVPVQNAIAIAFHEMSKGINPSLFSLVAAIGVGAANIISMFIETGALRRENYSASLASTVLNTFTKRPFVASFAGNVIDHCILTFLNLPVYLALLSGDNQLLIQSFVATSLTLTSWHIAMNSLIAAGKISPVIDKMRTMRRSLMGIFNGPAIN